MKAFFKYQELYTVPSPKGNRALHFSHDNDTCYLDILTLSFNMLRFSLFEEKKKSIKAVGLTLSDYRGIFHNLYINVIFKERMDYHAYMFVT